MIIKIYGDSFQKKASDLWPTVGFNLGVLWVAKSYLTSRCSTSRQRSAMSWKDLASSLRVCMICSDTGGGSMFVWPSWAGESTGERERGQNTNHFTTCLLGFEMTCYFVVHNVVFTHLANTSVGGIRHPDRIDYFRPWLNTEAQMIESVCRMTKNRPSELKVTSAVIWPNRMVYACDIYKSAGGCSVLGFTLTQMFVKGHLTPSEAAEPDSERSDHPTLSHICLPWSCQLCSHSCMCQHFKY